MALIDDFKCRFPEFEVADADLYIPILEPVWPCYYGGSYEGCGVEIILNLLAHLLVGEISEGSDSERASSSISVGNVSESFEALSASTSDRLDWLRSTKYGQRYIMLTKSRRGGCFV